MTEAGVIPPHPYEVGRVMVTSRRFGHGRTFPVPLRVAIVDGCVALAIAGENVVLDAAQRDAFMRLWTQAERQLESSDD